MPVIKKKTPQFIHVDEDDPQYIDSGEKAQPSDHRLNLDPRVKALRIEIVSVHQLKPNPSNAKKHSERQISVLAANIDHFGFWIPVLADEDDVIQAGHARWLAAQRIGLHHLPVVRQSELTPAQKVAWAISDNKISELSEWNYEILGKSFEFIDNSEIDFDLRLTGFETVEIDQILDFGAQENKADPADRIPELDPQAAAVTARGDVWQCGQHILICGDALCEADYAALMGNDRAQILFTDAPYNVPNTGHVTKREGVREFEMACGEMSDPEFTGFLHTASTNIHRFMNDGAVAYLCMDWRHMKELRTAADQVFGTLRNLIVWVKPNAGMGSFYRSQHELIFVYRMPGKHVNNFGLGGTGRHRSNVWTYPGLSSFGRDRDETLALHPTVKPVAMVKDALKDCSHRGDIVLDPFGGSGTTMIAAEKTKRRARLIEIDPIYCDTTVERWQRVTGKTACHRGTHETFAEVRARRQSEGSKDR